ncbi:MAG: hypothetical protein ACJ798_17185 [Phenylobacterium sp.]
MGDFSAERAITAGFGVIRRKPAALLAWAAVYFVGAILPQGLIWSRMAPIMALTRQGQAPDPQMYAEATSGMFAWAPLMWIVGLAVSSVLYGAVFRAQLEPEDDRYLYLRLTARELWLGLTMIALTVVFVLGGLLTVLAITLVGHSAPGIVTFVVCLAAIVAFVWLAMRMSLATAMAFAERRFVFAEVWPLTAGHALKLFGVMLALIVILVVLEMVLFVPIGLALGFSGAMRHMSSGAPPDFGQMLPWLFLGGVLASLFGAAVLAIIGAPWASIYQQLTGTEAPAA